MIKDIIILGGGPSGLFTAIFANKKFKNINIEIIESRNITNEIGRLRQIIILKKEYKIFKHLYKLDNFINLFYNFIECILYKSKKDTAKFNVGPLKCIHKKNIILNYDKFINDPNIIGVTITITNIQLCLIEYIKRYKNIKFNENKHIDIKNYVKDNYKKEEVIVIGCTGAIGAIRTLFTSPNINDFLKKYPKFNNLNYELKEELRNYYIKNNAGLEDDNYMLIVRYPYITDKKKDDINNIGFGWIKDKNDVNNKSSSIFLTNYLVKETKKYKFVNRLYKDLIEENNIFYRQLYYFIDLETFSKLGDCNFWTSCSIKDYENNRYSSIEFIKKKEKNVKTILKNIMKKLKYDKDNKNKNIIVDFNSTFYKNNMKLGKILTNINFSYLIFRIIDFITSRNILLDFKLNDKVLLILYNYNERPYVKKYNKVFECTIKEISIIGKRVRTSNGTFFTEILIQYGLEINNNDTNIINKLCEKGYIVTMNLKKNIIQENLRNVIMDDLKLFNKNININDILNKTELIRIWTAPRITRKVYQKIAGYLYCLSGDELLLVDPMIGRGVSNSIIFSNKLIQNLSKNINNTFNNLEKYEKFVYKIGYETFKQAENIPKLFSRFDFSFNQNIIISSINVLNPSSIYNNYRNFDNKISKDKIMKYENKYFKKYRMNDILKYIEISNKNILFLQEVNNEILEKIKNNKDFLIYNIDYEQVAVWKNKNNIKFDIKDDYIVTLIPKYYEKFFIIENDFIPLVSMKYGVLKFSNVNILISKENNSKIILINIHINRNNTDIDNKFLNIYIEKIKIKYNFNNKIDKIIIGGDFNKNIIKVKNCKKYGINQNTHDNYETDYFISNFYLNIIYDIRIKVLKFVERFKYIYKNKNIPYEKNSFTDHLIISASFIR